MLSFFIALLGVLVISVIVFGGGQIFIPFFKILLIDLMNVEIESWESALSLANATPGVFSTKLAFISGFLASNGEWWGFIAMFVTYLVFAIPPMIIIYFAMKKLNKSKKNKYIFIVNKLMKPIIVGILSSLIIQLAISSIFPYFIFNSTDGYIDYKPDDFFKGWRLIVLIVFSVVSIFYSYYFIVKKKINLGLMIFINISIAFLVFQPWLN